MCKFCRPRSSFSPEKLSTFMAGYSKHKSDGSAFTIVNLETLETYVNKVTVYNIWYAPLKLNKSKTLG